MKKNGFAIVLMLIFLLSIGAVLGFQQGELNVSSRLDQRLSRLQSLSAAKQSLLHYASTYSDLYGPSGSGPGHLPCPDTDAHRVSLDDAERISPFFGDSPDPPCGRGSHALGYLPRHVSLADTRYAFHAEVEQNIWYRLESSYVNNPLNRVVNSQSVQVSSSRRKIVDLVFPPGDVLDRWSELDGLLDIGDRWTISNRRDNFVAVAVTDHEILRVTTRRVLRWFIDNYKSSRVISCENYGRCNAVPESLVGCPSLDLAEVSTLLWLMPDTEVAECHASMLEAIDLQRHWFMRNEWFETFDITVDDACLEAHYTSCQLIRLDDHNLSLVFSS